MTKTCWIIVPALLLLGAWGEARATAAAAEAPVERLEDSPKELDGVGIDEKLGGQVPLNLTFTDADGGAVKLSDIITSRRPVLLTLNYSDCPMLCNLQLDGLVEGLRGIAWSAGEQFDILTVSINPAEKLDRTRAFRDKYLSTYERATARAGWHFLTGNEQNIEALARAVGFGYRFVPERQEYAHTAAAILLSPEGLVTRYLYGVLYEPRDLRFALVEAAEGKVGSTVDRILLYCFHYDAAVGKYAPMAANIMRLGGVVTVILLAGILGAYWLRETKSRNVPLG
jgi:protein SCO1/2